MASCTITQSIFSEVLGFVPATTSRRLRGVPRHRGAKGHLFFELADVLPILAPRERHHAATLAALAESSGDDDLYVGEGAGQRAKLVYGWLDPRQRDRLLVIQAHFAGGLTDGMGPSARGSLLDHLPNLNLKLLLHPPILKFVVTNCQRPDIDWPLFAPAFAIINAAHDLDMTQYEEAA